MKISLNLKVDPHHLTRLDDLAEQYGCNRSEIARLIFDNIQTVQRPVIGAVLSEEKTIRVAGNVPRIERQPAMRTPE